MFQWLLCETREPDPRQVEHALHTLQKNRREIRIELREEKKKVLWLTSVDWSSHFEGSSCKKFHETPPPPKATRSFWVAQKKGPLLPIKRFSQFEDRTQKNRIAPLDTLLPMLAKTPGSFVKITLCPIPSKKRERAVKKVKQEWFEPDRSFDQWESKGWFEWKWRRLWGPLIRIGLPKPTNKKSSAEEQMESQHEREDPRKAILDKLSRPLFKVEIESSHPFKEFIHGFNLPYLGVLRIQKKPASMILSAEELASLLSPPHPKTCAPFLETETSANLPCTLDELWNMPDEDRKRHLYFLGKTGMGKSTALLHLFQQDLQKEGSIVLLDPHGDLIDDALSLIPEQRHKDLLWIDPSQETFALALNPLEALDNSSPALQSSSLVEMFQVLAKGSWGPRLEYILRNVLLLLISTPNTTLLDLPRVLTSPHYCREKLRFIHDLEVRRFFEEEFLSWDERTRQEYTAPILNKVGPLLTLPILRNIFAQPKSKLEFSTLLNKNKILLISLSKGKLGEDASRFLGMVLISLIQSALLSRAKEPLHKRSIVKLSIDEFQNFATPTLLSMLSESRKYGLALTLANQYLTQLPPEIQDAVLGNVGSQLCFRICQADAELLAPSLGLVEEDLTQMAPFHAYGRWLYEGKLHSVFRTTIESIDWEQCKKNHADLEKLKSHSLRLLGRPRDQIEEKLKIRYNTNELSMRPCSKKSSHPCSSPLA